MTDPSSVDAPNLPAGTDPPSASPRPATILISAGEFLWLTLGVWVGGIFILALMPVIMIPRLGMPLGVVASYLLFFLTWQPIQIITQRMFGMRAGVIRMILFVGAAATMAFYLREALLSLSRG